MAKKTTIIEETSEVTPTEEHDKAVLETLDTKDGALEIKTEDLTAEKTEEEKKAEEEAKVKEEIDTKAKADEEETAEKEKLKEEVTKTVKDEIVSQLVGTKEEKRDAYAEFEKQIWDKEKRTPTYNEALDFVKTQAKDEIKAELNAEIEEENKQKEEEVKAQEIQQQQLDESLNKDWDEQLNDLIRLRKIPAIKDPENNEVQIIRNADGKEIERIPQEPGKRVRYELFKAMFIASEDRIANNLKPLINLKEIYYEHYNPNKQPAGANAPIAGIRKSVSQESGNTFKYSEIHNKPMAELLRETQ